MLLYVKYSTITSLFVCRIVCEMGKAEMSQYTGNVQVCVGQCTSDFMAKSSKYYYFVVSFCFHFNTFSLCSIICIVFKLKKKVIWWLKMY